MRRKRYFTSCFYYLLYNFIWYGIWTEITNGPPRWCYSVKLTSPSQRLVLTYPVVLEFNVLEVLWQSWCFVICKEKMTQVFYSSFLWETSMGFCCDYSPSLLSCTRESSSVSMGRRLFSVVLLWPLILFKSCTTRTTNTATCSQYLDQNGKNSSRVAMTKLVKKIQKFLDAK